MGIAYRFYTNPRQERFVWRSYAPAAWTNPVSFGDNEPYFNEPAIVYLGGQRYGVLYLSWHTPFERAAYFDIINLAPGTSVPLAGTPEVYALEQNYPNPFNPSTTIRFTVGGSKAALVTVSIFDVLGREIRNLVAESRAPGDYQVEWGGTDNRGKSVSSGVYFCRLKAGTFTATRSMMLLR